MPVKRVRIMPQAERDLNSETVYLAEEADAETGIRFFEAAHETFQALLVMPGMGRLRALKNPRLTDMRQWSVSGFEKYLIFYRTVPTGIDVVRVLHGARDVNRVLDEETQSQ